MWQLSVCDRMRSFLGQVKGLWIIINQLPNSHCKLWQLPEQGGLDSKWEQLFGGCQQHFSFTLWEYMASWQMPLFSGIMRITDVHFEVSSCVKCVAMVTWKYVNKTSNMSWFQTLYWYIQCMLKSLYDESTRGHITLITAWFDMARLVEHKPVRIKVKQET